MLAISAEQRFTIVQSGLRRFDSELFGYEYSIDDATTSH
jgi:hypothetical protein